MDKLTNQLLTFFIMVLSVISIPLTRKMRTNYGKLLGLGIFILSKKRREITYSNLQLAFPDKSLKEVKSIALKSYQNLGITFAELFALKHISEPRLKEYIKFADLEGIMKIYERNKGIIFLSAHFGNWEMMAYAFSVYSNVPMTIIVKPQKNRLADKYLNAIRTSRGNRIISMHRSAFEIVKCLKRKETIALLADQAAQRDKDLYVEFFGRLASTYEAPAQLALKLDVPIIMGFTIRQPDGFYIIETFELDHSHLENTEEGIAELTKMHVKILEDYIRRYPEQWVWQHRRWKHSPKKEE